RKFPLPRGLRSALDFASLYLTEICVLALGGFLTLWLGRVVCLRWLVRKRGGEGSSGGAVSVARTPGYLDGFLHLWAERGVVRRPGQTILEFIDHLKAEGHCNVEFDEMLNYV